MYCRIKDKVKNTGPHLARVMNSMELQNILKEALKGSIRTLQLVSTSVAMNMSIFFGDGHDDDTCVT